MATPNNASSVALPLCSVSITNPDICNTRVNIINTNPIQIPLITIPNIFRLLISDPDTALVSNKVFSPEIIINAHKVAKAHLSHPNKA